MAAHLEMLSSQFSPAWKASFGLWRVGILLLILCFA